MAFYKADVAVASMKAKEKIIQDPVCGMIIEENETHKLIYRSNILYFCSKECLSLFLSSPERYVGKVHLHGVYPLI